jgi:hypothetical protein
VVDFTKLPLYLGAVSVSPAAAAAVTAANDEVLSLLVRHAAGDWGDVDDQERTDNWAALTGNSGSVASVFRVGSVSVAVVTNMSPRETSIVLLSEV